MLDRISNTKAIITLSILSLIALILGSTFAFMTWTSNNLVTVNVTTNMGEIGLTFDGGGATSVSGLYPEECTHPSYAAMIPLTIDRYNETNNPATVTLTLKITSFTWAYAKPTSNDLDYIKIAITNSNSSCSNSFVSGTLKNITTNNSASTAQAQNTTILTWDYILPENSGTQSSKVHETYYMYVWIDKKYEFVNYGNNQVQDPIEGLSFTTTWSLSDIDQVESINTLYQMMKDNADTTATINFNKTSTSDNTNGLYRLSTTANDVYPVYFYRGNVTNNNVYFANKCWKIVRTTSTGGVKLIYNGLNTGTSEAPACNNTGTDSQIGTSTYNTSYNSPAYAGYMYGTVYTNSSSNGTGWIYAPDVTYENGVYTLVSKTINNVTYNVETKNTISGTNLNYHHYTCGSTTDITCQNVKYVPFVENTTSYYITLSNGKKVRDAINEMLTNSSNTTSSTIKTYIDTWYSNNMTSYTQYLEDTIWCDDRSIYSLGGWNPNGGSTSSNLYFYSRNVMESDIGNTIPKITCNKNDSFTVNDTINGNGKLTYPVALITADELVMAGGKYGASCSFYLSTGQNYFGLDSRSFDLLSSNVGVWTTVASDGGYLANNRGLNVRSVRPLVSLKNSMEVLSGDGTISNPYIVG